MIGMSGQRIGKLLVEGLSHKDKRGEMFWSCVCDCGGTAVVSGNSLRRPDRPTTSCGCLRVENRRKVGYKSNKGSKPAPKTNSRGTGAYTSWRGMKDRCLNPNATAHKYYENVGVCDRWLYFPNFLEDMGGRPYGCTLERVDRSKGYNKENCVWATWKTQSRNTCRTVMITYNGETMCLSDWANRLGLVYGTLYSRLYRYGWDVNRALGTP